MQYLDPSHDSCSVLLLDTPNDSSYMQSRLMSKNACVSNRNIMTLTCAILSQMAPGQINHSCFVEGALQISENPRLRQAKIGKFGKRASR